MTTALRDPATAYATAVVRGRVPAGLLHRAACARHLRDIDERKRTGLVWSAERAAHVLTFASHLRHWKGEWRGRPLVLEPWQAFVVGSIFGWLRADGTRRFRIAYIEIPRKNGKSTLGGIIALYLACCDGEPGAEVYCAATKREQARIVFETCRQMVRLAPALARRLDVREHAIVHPESASTLQPVSADASTMDGLNVHGAVIDELHAHRTSAVVDVLETATAARRQPLQCELTTAGIGQASVCWRHHDYTARVVDAGPTGIVDEAWFGFIAGADPDDAFDDPKVWAKANPNFGVSVKREYLADKAAKASQFVTAQNVFKQKHLDMWVEQAERWIDMRDWDACGAAVRSLPGTRPAYGGLDLAQTRDFAAFVIAVLADDGVIELVPRFYIPEARLNDRAAQSAQARSMLQTWVDAGHLSTTPGNVTDFAFIKRDVLALAEAWRLVEVGYDTWNALQLALELEQTGIVMAVCRQGFGGMSNPMADFGARIREARLRHGAHPVLRWMAGNMVAQTDVNGNQRPDRKRATDKIDGIVASLMAVDRAIRHQLSSAYDDHDLVVGTSDAPADDGW
jgi:phage terminase large subunit-like protein